MKPILFTHGSDMDGVSCAVLYKSKFGANAEVRFCDHDDVDNAVRVALADGEYTHYYITDISVDKETALLLDGAHQKGKCVRLLDHHKTALWLNQYEWAKVDTSMCGTLLFYHDQEINNNYYRLATIVNDYDTWQHKFPISRQINQLLYIIGADAFIERYLANPSVDITEQDALLLTMDDRLKQKYFESLDVEVRKLSNGKSVAVAFCEQYISEIGHAIIEMYDVDAVALININNGSISLRSCGDVDVSEIAKVRGGGGHKNAAGFKYGWPFTSGQAQLVEAAFALFEAADGD